MSPSTFKSMYLISKHDFEKNSSRDFKLSLENKDICDGGVNVSIKPVKNRKSNTKYISSEKEQFDNSPSQKQSNGYIEKNSRKSDEIQDIEQKNEFEKNNDIMKQNVNSIARDKIMHQANSSIQNKDMERSSNEKLNKTEIQQIQEYEPMARHKRKSKTFKSLYYRPNKASTKHLIRFKSQNVDPRIAKSKGSVKQNNNKNYNIKRQNNMSDNDEADARTTEYVGQQYPTIPFDSEKSDHNSEKLDHISDNMDNQMESVDDENKHGSINSSREKNNFSDMNQDQWVGSLKSKLNDRRVQFKRKRDTVGYRINPETDDIAKSLVTPSDFKYLDEADSDEYLSKWKSLKTVQQKPYSIKRFKSYS